MDSNRYIELMKQVSRKILILNGSPQGTKGNCAAVIKLLNKKYQLQSNVLSLTEKPSFEKIKKHLIQADGFIFVTGTYWDSWGSPLQYFLETVTPLEGSSAFLGKPCSVLVLNHSVGGKGVLSRLQGVLSTLGCLIPPMSGWVYSLTTELLFKQKKNQPQADDFWSLQDLDIVIQNLQTSLSLSVDWKSWPVDRKNFKATWLKTQ